jgi:hypothetical protein
MQKNMHRLILLLCCLLAYADYADAAWRTIWNGPIWYDTDAHPIHAHGGGFLKQGDTYYWFGEDKSHNSHHFKAVNCYSSNDLTNWTFRHAVLTKATHSDLDQSGRVIERPKVVYNASSGEFVMWMHWESSDYSAAECGIAKCTTVDGDYELVAHYRPNNNMSRDCTLFLDDDGTAYFISAANHNADLIMYELTDDYLDIKREVATLWPGQYREAPALIKKDGTYYLISSGATGWDPNQAKYGTAAAMEGPWSSLFNIGNDNTFDSQSTYILSVMGSQDTTYLFCADRWQDPDLERSKYIWLPLSLGDNAAALTWYDIWQINAAAGLWGREMGDIPAVPENFSAQSSSATQIELSWEDKSDNEGGFEIERRRDDAYRMLHVGINGTTIRDTGLLPGRAYTYRIRAVNGAGYSAYTPEIVVKTASAVTDTLIGYYQLNTGSGSIAVDASVYGHDGILRDSPKWVKGCEGSALEFNGSNSFVDLGTSAFFDLQEEITVAAWIKQYDAGNGEHNPWITKGDYTFGLKHYMNNAYQFFIYDGGWYSVNSPSSTRDNDQWHHFIGTYDGTELRLYMDGTLKARIDHEGSINIDSGYHVNLARNTEHTDRLFNGVMDEIKIFNIALNENEAKQLHQEKLTDILLKNAGTNTEIFILHQNYPNPFNNATMIHYQLIMNSEVELSIFSLLGRKVATLVEEKQQPGTYQVQWNARGLTSGVYFYRFTAKDFLAVGKCLMLP